MLEKELKTLWAQLDDLSGRLGTALDYASPDSPEWEAYQLMYDNISAAADHVDSAIWTNNNNNNNKRNKA